MEELMLNDQIVLFDREATTSVYHSIDRGDADGCHCGRSFRQFRSQAYGPKLLAILERLGIDLLKEWEAYSSGVEVDEHIENGGWVVFVGEWSAKNTVRGAGNFAKEADFSISLRAFQTPLKNSDRRSLQSSSLLRYLKRETTFQTGIESY
jgi:hypothetical protein